MSGLWSWLFALLYSFFIALGLGSFFWADNVCSWSLSSWDYLISPKCFQENNLPQFWFKETTAMMWQFVDRFDDLYELDKQEFSYYWAKPVMKNNFSAQNLTTLKKNWIALKRYSLIGKPIRVTKYDLAYDQFKQFSFYWAERQIDNYGACSRTNYLVALWKLEWLYLEPGEKYTINDALSNQPNYCMGSVPGKYLFYQGVCGASTQLFRVSLLMPKIEITERANHSQRYVKYYDEYVYWDDAAIYERSKKLSIVNSSSEPVFFKTLGDEWVKYLIWITPTTDPQFVKLSKKQTGRLKWEVTKTVFDKKTDTLTTKQSWTAFYSKKNYEQN